MAEMLHRAIRDALADSDAYRTKGIMVTTVLEASLALDADETLLYRAVYTIFRALPERLLPGSALNVSTSDVDGCVELLWEAREHDDEEQPGDLRTVLVRGPHGDLFDVALQALESFCNLRAGTVETKRRRMPGSSFERPYVVRRVRAYIPRAAPDGAGRPASTGGARV